VAIDAVEQIATIKHGVTRFRITLACFQAVYRCGSLRDGGLRWVKRAHLPQYPLNSTGRRISRLLGSGGTGGRRR
jgi:hypothetical protein